MIGRSIERAVAALPASAVEIEQAIKRIPGLESAGARFSSTIHKAVLSGGSPARAVADALHGTWFGHPLHAALSDIPVGAWSLAAIFDAYAGMGAGRFAEQAADSLLAIGVVAAVPTALAGIADYSAIDDQAIAVGAAHGLLNSAGLGLFLLSIWARSAGRRRRGVLLSSLGLAIAGAAAGLGGDLVYRMRVGVNHAEPADKPARWTAVLPLDDLAEGQAQRVELAGKPVLVYHDAEQVYAIGAVCTHAGAPLEKGTFADGCVECPWHQSVFDLSDGSVVHGPATTPQPSYEARVRNGQVELRKRPDRMAGAKAKPAAAHA